MLDVRGIGTEMEEGMHFFKGHLDCEGGDDKGLRG
jgi:hypothetical protein